jgi:hypothetical protein
VHAISLSVKFSPFGLVGLLGFMLVNFRGSLNGFKSAAIRKPICRFGEHHRQVKAISYLSQTVYDLQKISMQQFLTRGANLKSIQKDLAA